MMLMYHVANSRAFTFFIWLALSITLCNGSKFTENIKSTASTPQGSSKNNGYYELEGNSNRMGGRASTSYETRRRRRSTDSVNEQPSKNPISSMFRWIKDNQSSLPRVQVRVEPTTTLKLRKRFRPLFKTVVTLGADFNTQLGVWQFKSSWEDSIIGGRLTLQ